MSTLLANQSTSPSTSRSADQPLDPAAARSADQTVDIAERVRRIAATDPQRVALVHATRGLGGAIRYREHTYRELSDRAEALASGLRALGVGRGTRCSFMVPPGIDAMVLGVSLWSIGAVVVGIEPHSHGLRSVARSLAKVGPEVFIGTPSAHAARLAFGWGRGTIRTNVVAGRMGLPGVPTLRSLERGTTSGAVDDRDIRPEDLAVIAFTTGSTGAPKPTVLRQRNLAAMMSTVLGHWGYDNDGEVVDMTTFPMFWIIGLAAGGTVVVPPMDFTLHGPADADPALLVRTIQECGVRSMFASPALLTNLASYAHERGITLPTIERIVAGGAEVPGPLFREVRSVLGRGAEIFSDYGATEAIPVAEIAGSTVLSRTWPATERGAGVCVGRPLPGVEVRIVAIDDGPIPSWDQAVVVRAGEVGEIVVRSPHVSEGYYRDARADEENKIADPSGTWHRIGDIGYLDAEGLLWLCGRRSQRVVTSRGVAFPLCCEPVFNAHPTVRRSALVGTRDASGRVTATMCVELRAGTAVEAATRELRALASRNPETRLVERIEVVDRLPVDRRHNAKIDRPRLAEQHSDPAATRRSRPRTGRRARR